MQSTFMKKIILTCAFALFCLSESNSQSYQKAYGATNPNQQELYDLFTDSEGNIFTSGTFRNLSVFEQDNYYGSVSRINPEGNTIWHKAYLPEEYEALDSFFINSVYADNNGSLYCFGVFLDAQVDSGYYIMKLDADGEVIWAKFISDGYADLITDTVYTSEAIYLIYTNRIVKMNFSGEVVNVVNINLGFEVALRKAIVTSSGNLVITGELYLNNNWNTPVIIFDSNLNLINGYLYYRDENGATYGTALCEAADDELIIGLSDRSVFSINQSGELQWVKTILANETETTLDALDYISNIQPLNAEKTEFYIAMNGSYFDDIINLLYVGLGNMDNNGNISNLKAIKKTPFETIDNYHSVSELIVDSNTGYYHLAGKLIASDGDEVNHHYNYLHKGSLSEVGCGEEAITFNTSSTIESLNMSVMPAELFVQGTVQIAPATITVQDLPLEYDETYCIDALLQSPDLETDAVALYPNPASDIITVQANQDIKEMMVFDVLGKTVGVTFITDNTINVAYLDSGMYIIKVLTADNKTFTLKFVKQ
ncbi:MAG: hypothetical protein CMP77_01360 [Flavobacterium sp.]|nr:hypothetical protein [Flavobacterium sp.]|tara:strand:- start:16318 stop:17937 length:1620 start_codon:yes stop_codon:yes gene_type:complete